MSWLSNNSGAIIGAVGSAAGGYIAASAADDAAKAQVKVANNQLAVAAQLENKNRTTMQPFVTAGYQGLDLQGRLSGAAGADAQREAYSQYVESPGVAWRREQGMKGLYADSAASGVGGGTRLKALSEYNQGLASQDFTDYYNRLGNMTSSGLTAAGAMAGQSIQAATQTQSALGAMGAAQAGASLARGQAFSDTAGSLATIGATYFNDKKQTT